MLTIDAIALPMLLWLACALRFNTLNPDLTFTPFYFATTLIVLPLLFAQGFYRSVVRFFGPDAIKSILLSVIGAVVGMAAMAFMLVEVVPRSVFLIYALLLVFYLGASRLFVRQLLLLALQTKSLERLPVAIFGAGSAGAQLLSALMTSGDYRPAMLVDDDSAKCGGSILGVPIVGRRSLVRAVEQKQIKLILLAIPRLASGQRAALLKWLETLEIQVQTVPSLKEIADGKARLDDFQDIAISDLLGRDPVPADIRLLQQCVRGQNILVTGAGGSIGAELCRQLVAQYPLKLVLLEQSEVALYSIERELAQLASDMDSSVEVIPMLGSVITEGLVERICSQLHVDTMFHAAAYKHVPIIESNPAAGIINNILGTHRSAMAANNAGVKRYILISTDKSVRPSSVMGATKRFSELILQGLNDRGSNTVFSMVRFGNVLDSSGSVVPLFRDQILHGGPVTVTHPEITRFFMTITEAAELVIQSSALAKGGDVFVLEMGQPVKIVDLARTMIHLMGLRVRKYPDSSGGIDIVFTGLRPGEKLHEELFIGDKIFTTDHPKILRVEESHLAWETLQQAIEELTQAVKFDDTDAYLRILSNHIEEYRPKLNAT